MNKLKWIAEGPKVIMVSEAKREPFCTVSAQLLTPNLAAQEIADALNDKFAN